MNRQELSIALWEKGVTKRPFITLVYGGGYTVSYGSVNARWSYMAIPVVVKHVCWNGRIRYSTQFHSPKIHGDWWEAVDVNHN